MGSNDRLDSDCGEGKTPRRLNRERDQNLLPCEKEFALVPTPANGWNGAGLESQLIAANLPQPGKWWQIYLVPLIVLVGTLTLAGIHYWHFWGSSRLRWDGPVHDRNAHYLLGLSLAVDVQQGNVKQLLSDLDGARTWPPLHGILVAGTLLVGGIDDRLAVLPSLAGWVGAVMFGFLLARRLPSWGGNLAGLTAVILILASPAHRAYATDIMLESLGAGLSLAALYFYVVATQDNSRWSWRALGLTLTALLLHKYNYWLLVVIGLVGAEVSTWAWSYWRSVAQALARIDWRSQVKAQLRHPLNYLLVVLVALVVLVVSTGGTQLRIGARQVSIQTPHNLVHAAYVVFLLRIFLIWRKEGKAWWGQLSDRARLLACWHLLPLSIWFLMPRRLGYLIWFVSPANSTAGQRDQVGQGTQRYWAGLVNDYHQDGITAMIVIGLLALALVGFRRLRPGARAVLLFVLLAAALTVLHPNQKHRYLHSWMGASWVGAGAGLALLLQGLASQRGRQLRPWLAGGVLTGLALVHGSEVIQPGHAQERGLRARKASIRDLTEAYLPLLDDSRHVAILGSMPLKHMAAWSYLERYRRHDRLESDPSEAKWAKSLTPETFERWLQTSSCDTIVYIDVPPGSYFFEKTGSNPQCARFGEMLRSQSTFQIAQEQEFPHYGCRVTVWKRGPSAQHYSP